MFRFITALILIALAFAARPASAFGVLGHQVVASLAEDMLTPKAKAEVRAILGPAGGPTSLASVATWADDIRMLRPQTRPWHYVTIQISEPRYDAAKADTPNVVEALEKESAILADPHADRYAREEALKWVVHLTGDLHQPLHTGEDHDKGGNLAKVKVNRRTYNLHEVWDYVLLERLHLPLDSLRGMLEREIAADPGFIQRNAKGTVEQWVDESHAKAAGCYILRGKPMRKGIKLQLDKGYVSAATLTVLEQLKLGGVRLAYLLNRDLDPGSKVAAVQPAIPPAGWHDDKGAFFAHADSIKDIADTGAAESVAAPEGAKAAAAEPEKESTGKESSAKAHRSKTRGPKIPAGTYAWSVNSDVYHFSECADVARIKKKNLRTGDTPPPGMHLHAGCPIPR